MCDSLSAKYLKQYFDVVDNRDCMKGLDTYLRDADLISTSHQSGMFLMVVIFNQDVNLLFSKQSVRIGILRNLTVKKITSSLIHNWPSWKLKLICQNLTSL